LRNDFIIDFETIGQVARKVPVIDCSYLVFSWDRFLEKPYSLHELQAMAKKSKLSIEDQVKNYDFEYRKEDLNWWMEQPKIVRKNLTPKPDDLTVKQFMEKLIIDLRGSEHIDYWWSRSNTFDPVILEHLSMSVERQSELNELLPWWKVRDTRTFIDAKFNFTSKNGFIPVTNEEMWELYFNKHDSTCDIAADVLRLQAIHRAEHDLELTEI